MKKFFLKMRGSGTAPPGISLKEIALAFVGSLLAISLIAILNIYFFQATQLPLLLGSFGASAVLVFGVPRSPLAQPRNVVGGHIISALIGVLVYKLIGEHWLSSGLAVALAISLMHLTLTLHPPGGATALIAVTGGPVIYKLGFLYILFPCVVGATIMIIIALFFNNLSKKQQYPQFWW